MPLVFWLVCGWRVHWEDSTPSTLATPKGSPILSRTLALPPDFQGKAPFMKMTWQSADPSSHINAETPGAIHEGGELGYALSVSFGAVMDKPDLIVTCIVGDGEAETGPTAT